MFWHDKCSSRACLARIMECLVVMCAFYLPTKTLPRSSQDIKDGKIIGRGRNWIKNVGEPGRYTWKNVEKLVMRTKILL